MEIKITIDSEGYANEEKSKDFRYCIYLELGDSRVFLFEVVAENEYEALEKFSDRLIP